MRERHPPQDVFLGIDIGGTFTKLGLLSPGLELVAESRIETRAAGGPDPLVSRVTGAVRDLATAAGGVGPPPKVVAAGVAMAGLVDVASGVLRACPNLRGWEGYAPAGGVREALGIDVVVVENDASACALAEATLGAARGRDPVALITLGTGMGGGLVAGGRIVHGKRGFAGEFGHMVLDVDGGPECACGARGCVESFVRAERVVALARELASSMDESPSPALARALASGEPTAQDIGEAAAAGDPVATAVFSRLGRYLGIAIANIICAVNPEAVVVAGGVALAGGALVDAARRTAQARLMSPLLEGTLILPAALGDRGGMLGAALLASARNAPAA